MEENTPLLFFEEEVLRKHRLVILFLILLAVFLLAVLTLSIPLSFLFLFLLGAKTLLKAGIGGILGIFFFSLFGSSILWWYLNQYGYIQILQQLEAKNPDPKDRYHQIYEHVVEEMAISSAILNLAPMVLPTKAFNAFSLSLGGERYILALSEGALSKLTRSQIQGLVAHTVARSAVGDARIATAACSMIQFFYRLNRYFGNFVFYVLGGRIFSSISRENLLRADASAVRLTRNPQALAEALYICGNSWSGASTLDISLSPLFSIPPVEGLQERIKKLSEMAKIDDGHLKKALEKSRLSSLLPPPPPEESQWYAQVEEKWKGPYAPGQLFSQGWFHPEIWLQRGTEKFTSPAFSHPDLSEFFQNRMPTSSQKCPACAGMLIERSQGGLEIQQCLSCQGKLLMQDQLLRLICRKEQEFSAETLREASEYPQSWAEVKDNFAFRKAGRLCPYCRNEMRNYPYSHAYPVVMDKCEGCLRIWLDTRELEILQHLIEQKKIAEEKPALEERASSEIRRIQKRAGTVQVPFVQNLFIMLAWGIALGGLLGLIGFFIEKNSFAALIAGGLGALVGILAGSIVPKDFSWKNPKIYGGAALGFVLALGGVLPLKFSLPFYIIIGIMFTLMDPLGMREPVKSEKILEKLALEILESLVILVFLLYIMAFPMKILFDFARDLPWAFYGREVEVISVILFLSTLVGASWGLILAIVEKAEEEPL